MQHLNQRYQQIKSLITSFWSTIRTYQIQTMKLKQSTAIGIKKTRQPQRIESPIELYEETPRDFIFGEVTVENNGILEARHI